MVFEKTDLEAIAEEIRRRKEDAGRLALVEFDGAEYTALQIWARRIVSGARGHKPARLVFLAFTMAFVRRTKYADDNAFWPDFEACLGLETMEKRPLMMDDLLWPAYEEEGLERTKDGRGRRIVGTLEDEMRQARTWETQARDQFVRFFCWYYFLGSDEAVSTQLLAAYRQQTGERLQVLDQVLSTLSCDCQALARVIDYAIEHDLYLTPSRLNDYRERVVEDLGPAYDPTRLRLIRDERALVRLILALQNHCTPAQFERELRKRRSGFVRSPWGERLHVRKALQRWAPFPYGVYTVEGVEYRVTPRPRLRLETLDEWPFEQVIPWRDGRYLGYKKRSPFEVTIGRRTVEAVPYVRSRHAKVHIWVGEVPTGQKLSIDGRLRPESAGADWQIALRLSDAGTDRPGLCVAITRLMLYYPEHAHQPMGVWTSAGHRYEDALREDGVRRFHRHRDLVFPLETFADPVDVTVAVGDEVVLEQTFEPEPHYLFSVVSHERVQARELADFGDREYVLFTRDASPPQTSAGVRADRLPARWGAYTVYRVTWTEPDCPFELRIGSTQWTFKRRRQFAALFDVQSMWAYLRLKPHQCLSFGDLSLRLYSTLDLQTVTTLTMEIYDDGGLLGAVDLSPHVSSTDARHHFDVAPAIWKHVGRLTESRSGRYVLRFLAGEDLLGETTLSLLPRLRLASWDEEGPHLAREPLVITVVSPDCLVWNPETHRRDHRAVFRPLPRTHAEPWPGRPALRRVVSEPVSTLVSFPGLSETVEVVVRPRLFGFRLYLKRPERKSDGKWRTRYQPLHEADYYHLNATALHVFSAPNSRVDLAVGALVAWEGETDDHGDLLIDSLACLCPACLGEETRVMIRSRNLRIRFVVRWAPLIREMSVEDDEVILCYDGPEETGVRLWLRDVTGETVWTEDVPCRGEETTTRVPLPAQRPALGYLNAGYVLTDGSVRSAMAQVQVEGQASLRIPPEWLREGVGVANLKDLRIGGQL